jgi:hypothetical protein
MQDPIFAIPAGVWSSVTRTEPVVLDRDGIPAVYFNYTYNNFVMSAQENETMLQGMGFGLDGGNWYPNENVNVTFDLTYGFWLYYTPGAAGAGGNYTLKLDTTLANIRFSNPSVLPSNLQLYVGSTTAAGFNGFQGPIYLSSVVSNDTMDQQFGFGTSIVSLTSLPNTYSLTNVSGTYSSTCTRSALPVYEENWQHQLGKPTGDSSHIYQWVLGASFPITNQTTVISYDPKTTIYAAAPPGQSPLNLGQIWILMVVLLAAIACGVVAVAFTIRRRRAAARIAGEK